jgi:hypothetical protein
VAYIPVTGRKCAAAPPFRRVGRDTPVRQPVDAFEGLVEDRRHPRSFGKIAAHRFAAGHCRFPLRRVRGYVPDLAEAVAPELLQQPLSMTLALALAACRAAQHPAGPPPATSTSRVIAVAAEIGERASREGRLMADNPFNEQTHCGLNLCA